MGGIGSQCKLVYSESFTFQNCLWIFLKRTLLQQKYSSPFELFMARSLYKRGLCTIFQKNSRNLDFSYSFQRALEQFLSPKVQNCSLQILLAFENLKLPMWPYRSNNSESIGSCSKSKIVRNSLRKMTWAGGSMFAAVPFHLAENHYLDTCPDSLALDKLKTTGRRTLFECPSPNDWLYTFLVDKIANIASDSVNSCILSLFFLETWYIATEKSSIRLLIW